MANKTTEPVVHSTTDYSIFKNIVGNRKVYRRHVTDLTKAIARKNMLSENPIIVNEKMQVVDGQHRLEAAKNNKLPIYYIVANGTDLLDVQDLNSMSRRWTGLDYLNSYADQGKEEYIKLRNWIQEYGINLNIGIALSQLGGTSGTTYRQFKTGKLTLPDEKKAEALFEAVAAIKPYTTNRAWNDREFIQAYARVLEDISVPELIVRLDQAGRRIEAEVTTKDYLRQFEVIVNYNMRKNIFRFF